MDISIRNYQSIKKADIEVPVGLTLIVGESNQGKTACLRALESAIYNGNGTTFIRHGCEKSIVGIREQGDKGFVYKWTRSTDAKNRTTIILDGESYSKLGSTQDEGISDKLGMRSVEVDGENIHINFWKQQDPPFLTNKTASQVYKVLTFNSESDMLSRIIKGGVKDLADVKSAVIRLEGSKDALTKTIVEDREWLDANADSLKQADSVLKLGDRVESLAKKESVLKRHSSLSQSLIELREAESESKVQAVDIASIQQKARRVDNMARQLDLLNKSKATVLEHTESMTANEVSSGLLESLLATSRRYEKMREVLSRYTSAVGAVAVAKTNEASAHEEAESYKGAREKLLKEIGYCPVCGKNQ